MRTGRNVGRIEPIVEEKLQVLLDTGAEVSLIRKKLVENYPCLRKAVYELAKPVDLGSWGPQPVVRSTHGLDVLVKGYHGRWWKETLIVADTGTDDIILSRVLCPKVSHRSGVDMRVYDLCLENTKDEVMTVVAQFPKVTGKEEPCPIYDLHPFEIQLKEGAQTRPIHRPPLKVSIKRQQVIAEHVKELLEKGLVRSSRSPWASNVHVVPKKNGKTRLVVDYRPVNAVTVRDQHPLPRMDSLMEYVSGASFFVVLDLKSGYLQLAVEEKSIPLTAFNTSDGLYEFTKMPFGLCNAPAHFVRTMTIVFSDMMYKKVLVYLDDILIFAKSPEILVSNVRAVMTRLQEYGVVINLEKCDFGVKQVRYLGFEISAEGRRVDPERLEGIATITTPTDVKSLRSFLGMVSYIREYVPNLSSMTAVLTPLTKKGVPFKWETEHELTFAAIKEKIMTTPLLVHPDFEQTFILRTDASKRGLGAVLSQEKGPISFISRSLLPAEKNYSTIELECLAIVWAVKKLRSFLSDQPFVIQTDHRNLSFLERCKNERVRRWALLLSEFSYSVEYQPGRTNAIADALSRCCVDDSTPYKQDNEEKRKSTLQDAGVEDGAMSAEVMVTTADKVRTPIHRTRRVVAEEEAAVASSEGATTQSGQQMSMSSEPEAAGRDESKRGQKQRLRTVQTDVTLRKMVQCAQAEMSPSEVERLRNSLTFFQSKSGLWCKRRDETSSEIVVPPFADELKTTLLSLAHDIPTASHMGVSRTFDRLASFYWEKKREDVKQFVHSCWECQRVKIVSDRGGLMNVWNAKKLFEIVHMDFLGPLQKTSNGNEYILVMVDRFSKFMEMVPTKSQDAEAAAEALWNGWFMRHGCPEVIVSDNGTSFTSGMMTAMMKLAQVKHRFTTPHNPKANGQVERFNKEIIDSLRTLLAKERNMWDYRLPMIQMAMNSAVNRSTGYSPFEIVYGTKARELTTLSPEENLQHWEDLQKIPDGFVKFMASRREDIFDSVKKENEKRSREYKARYDKGRKEGRLESGDLVLEYMNTTNKLQDKKFGPLKVVKDMGNNVYTVRELVVTNGEFKERNVPRDLLQLVDSSRLDLTKQFLEEQYQL